MKVTLIGNYPNDDFRSMDLFADSLLHWLSQNDIEAELIKPKVRFGNLIKGSTGIGKWVGYLDKFVLFPKKLEQVATKSPQDRVFHICDQSNSHYIKRLPLKRTLITCHDLMAIQVANGDIPEVKIGKTGRKLQSMILNGLRQCHYFSSVSAHTKETLKRFHEDTKEIRVIPNALVQDFGKSQQGDMELPSHLPQAASNAIQSGSYFLHVGNDNWYKNRSQLFAVADEILKEKTFEKYALILVGPPPSKTDQALISESVRNRIVNLNAVSELLLKKLYQHATCLLFLSKMEGFGWPILEAMSQGCLPVVFDIGPMNEVTDELGLKLPKKFLSNGSSFYTTEISSVIIKTLKDTAYVNDSVREMRKGHASKYASDAVFPRYINYYQDLLNYQH